MANDWHSSWHIVNQRAKARVAQLADRQFGRIKWQQLARLEVDRKTVHRWCAEGHLHRELPGVYAVGHRARSIESDLSAALLYAGPGAALSHTTAAWWWKLIDKPPQVIHVSTPRRCRSIKNIKVHGRRHGERILLNGLPTTTLAQIFLDLAATTSPRTLRRALANADYQGLLDPGAIRALTPGRPGAARLRQELRRYLPNLARTKSELEAAFLELCEQHGIPLPATNQWVNGWEVDALWLEVSLAVELDGGRNHQSPAQRRRDRQKDMAMRAAGLTPIRYSDEQIGYEARAVAAEVRALVLPPTPMTPRSPSRSALTRTDPAAHAPAAAPKPPPVGSTRIPPP